MINYFAQTVNKMNSLFGNDFQDLWADYLAAYNNEIQENIEIPGRYEICALIRFCLTKIEISHKRERCIIISFIFAFMLEFPKFVRHYQRFYQTAIDKAHELLEHDYLQQGYEPMCVSILQQFVRGI